MYKLYNILLYNILFLLSFYYNIMLVNIMLEIFPYVYLEN